MTSKLDSLKLLPDVHVNTLLGRPKHHNRNCWAIPFDGQWIDLFSLIFQENQLAKMHRSSGIVGEPGNMMARHSGETTNHEVGVEDLEATQLKWHTKLHFWFLFDFTAAGVVPCGGRKTSPRTSTIVQFIFYFGPLRSAIIFWEIRNKWLV